MKTSKPRIPAVLCFAGLDPTGGAGLQADIEAIVSMGGHPLPVATSLTAQDTRNVKAVMPIDPCHVVAQARAVLADVPVAAVKVGLLGSAGVAEALQDVLAECAGVPVVLDPVDRAGGGASLADDALMDTIVSHLVPRTTVLTPNTREARRLAPGAGTIAAAAERLVSLGCQYVLVTGADEATPLALESDDTPHGATTVLVTGADEAAPRVVNRLYGDGGLVESFEWPRVEGVFHGSGCTLAAAIAAGLARGASPRAAVAEAQQFTHDAVSNGYRIGAGQRVPDRMRRARGHGLGSR